MPDLSHLVAGTLGGLTSTVALYPLELIKTRMQVAEVPVASAATSTLQGRLRNPYGSVLGALQQVLRNEGVRGLYKGVTPAMIASSGSWGGYFYFYERSKSRKLGQGGGALTTVDHLSSGVEAGVILVFLFNPLWLIKTRMALQGLDSVALTGSSTAVPPARKEYTGIFHAVRTIVREEGFVGLYKGVIPALFLTSHGAVQFAVYEWLKTKVNEQGFEGGGKQPAWASVLIGGASKIIASTVTYPYQVIKSRIQQREASFGEVRYSGMLDCIVKTWRHEGLFGFLRGVVPNALKVAPSAALTFVVYEETLKVMQP